MAEVEDVGRRVLGEIERRGGVEVSRLDSFGFGGWFEVGDGRGLVYG